MIIKFIKWIHLLYENKTFTSIMDLNKVISKDEYKIIISYEKDLFFLLIIVI